MYIGRVDCSLSASPVLVWRTGCLCLRGNMLVRQLFCLNGTSVPRLKGVVRQFNFKFLSGRMRYKTKIKRNGGSLAYRESGANNLLEDEQFRNDSVVKIIRFSEDIRVLDQSILVG